MTQGHPPAPAIRNIVAGILLATLLCFTFFSLPSLVKYTGAVLTFLPTQLGLMDVVSPDEVMSVDMSASPTAVSFKKPGKYSLFTDNYDLLVVNDAIAAARGKPWFSLTSASEHEIGVTLVERGMALYDTPFAKGRPVAHFEIAERGIYSMIHPARPDHVYIVPDYTFGQEAWIVTLMSLQGLILAYILGRWWKARQARRKAAELAWRSKFSRSPKGEDRSSGGDGEAFSPKS
jgi:hypothetical protein